jgi:hypothetical protein
MSANTVATIDRFTVTALQHSAADAFGASLNEIAAGAESRTLNDVIERLRASKARMQSDDYKEGQTAGRKWAERSAEVWQLIRLAWWRDRAGPEWENCLVTVRAKGYYAGEAVAGTIMGVKASFQAAQSFWTSALPCPEKRHARSTNDDFVRGFADGALDVWDLVKDKL